VSIINRSRAKEIARKFLEQYNAPVTVNSAHLEGTKWIVSTEVGLANRHTRKVFIDSTNGRILSYTYGESASEKKLNR
jgi:uncharacterized membrane protein YkoI